MTPEDRRASVRRARDLFNTGAYWEAHEALETVWRSIISGGDDATRYVSWADWICPTHCIEPALCPAIGAPRTWEMSDSVRDLVARLRASGRPVSGPALFVCQHEVFGVGMFAAEAVRAGDRLVEATGGSGELAEVLVGTISSCHGALNLLQLGPRTTHDARRT